MKTKHLFLFLIIYSVLFFILFPGFRYVIDPDSTGYFSVAEQMAKGNFFNSVNGIWSPLGSWLFAPLIRLPVNEVLAAKYLNGVYGAATIVAFFYLVKKFRIRFFIEMAIMLTAVVLILHFTFFRLFASLLALVFFLLYINILVSDNFNKGYKKIILAGSVAGIAFYAKEYTFYFALLHLPVAVYIAEKAGNDSFSPKTFLKKALAGIIPLIVIAGIWLVVLNIKYGHFFLGQQNFTGSLSHTYIQPRVVFYAPPFPGAYSLFDDITYKKQIPVTPFTSMKVFVAQLKLIGFNMIETIHHFNDFSFALIVIILVSIFFYKNYLDQKKTMLLLSFILIWPLGYLFFHVEPRYLWIIDLTVLLLSGILASAVINHFNFTKKLLYIFALIIIGKFWIYPIIEMKNQYGSGKTYFAIADAFKKNHISGNLLYSNQSSENFSKSVIINFLSRNRQFGPFTTDYTDEEIAGAIKQYHINYYVLYYDTPSQKDLLLHSASVFNPTAILSDIYPGIIVLKFN
ncbi:MAG TPA: hypothetical protein VG847_01880 [Chitinophagaceae bacterium]|nr:hypothetical protein [Chitinophagaceae bacterium]